MASQTNAANTQESQEKQTRVQFPRDASVQDIFEAIKKLQQEWEKRNGRPVGATPPASENPKEAE